MAWPLYGCTMFLLAFLLSVLVSARAFELTVLHTNDVHSRIEEIDPTGGSCNAAEANAGECYGGMARMATKAPGNHDFDNGVEGLVPFLRNVTFPVVACNIDTSGEPELQGLIRPSVVLDIGGEKVGIVGYILVNTPAFSPTGNLVFLEEVKSVQAEVTKLLGQGVNKIIALGHAGYSKDQEVARRVSGVDVVVGGHTNTFLYTGILPSSEVPLGPYPLIIDSEVDLGRQVPVVQAYAYGKYLGHLRLTFDSDGDLVRWSGNPILLDNSIPKDPDVLEVVTDLKEKLNHTKEVIGRSNVFLQGVYETCTVMECNMGNLITDAMVHQNIKFPDELYWNDVAIGIYNSDSIRASMRKGLIDVESVLFTLPFGNTFDIVELRGEHLYEVFEYSGSMWSSGEFLQVSGILVEYDLSKPKGNRVVSLEARCTACDVPEFIPVQTDSIYKIILPSHLANGERGYSMISDNKLSHHIPALLDSDMLIGYIRATSPITTGVERRITFTEEAPPCTSGGTAAAVFNLGFILCVLFRRVFF